MKNNTLTDNLEMLEKLSVTQTVITAFGEFEFSVPRRILEQTEELLYELDVQPEIVAQYMENNIFLQYEREDDESVLEFTIEHNGAISVYTNYEPIEDLSYEEIDLDIDKINEIVSKFYK